MTTHASSGTCFAVSASAPSAHTENAFAQLGFTQVGELETVGDITRRKAAISFANLCTGKTTTLKGNEEGIQVTISIGMDRDDTGQALMSAAYASPNKYSFRVVESNGDIVYFQAYVMEDSIRYGGTTDVVKGSYTLGIAPSSTGVTLVMGSTSS